MMLHFVLDWITETSHLILAPGSRTLPYTLDEAK